MTENLFTNSNPHLQRAWDATSLNALQFCPRYYQYTILDGYRERGNNDLEFGGLFASCVETYKKAKLNGSTKQQATYAALRYAITTTWDEATDTPWSGSYREMWRCTGTEPYRNAKGNRAKCPYAHAGEWFDEPAPSTCGTCGSPTEIQKRWVSQYTKDRYALIRLVAAYCDAQHELASDGPYPFKFPNGDNAVELSFRYPLPYLTPDKEPYLAAGHIDSLMQLGEEVLIDDEKTTTKALNQKYWDTYFPSNQVSLYDVTGTVLWPSLNIQGVMITAAQITKTLGVEIGVHIYRPTEAQREEFLRDLKYWLDSAEKYATDNYWPMNRRNCWICPFKQICAMDPEQRSMFLDSNFDKRVWNPLEER